MTQDWLFVIGISLEIAGALLVLGGFIFGSRRENVARGMTFPTDKPVLSAQRERAYTYVGATVLAAGFGLQLTGYVVASGDAWFVAIAVAVMVAALWIGKSVVGMLAGWLHKRAVAAFGDLQRGGPG